MLDKLRCKKWVYRYSVLIFFSVIMHIEYMHLFFFVKTWNQSLKIKYRKEDGNALLSFWKYLTKFTFVLLD